MLRYKIQFRALQNALIIYFFHIFMFFNWFCIICHHISIKQINFENIKTIFLICSIKSFVKYIYVHDANMGSPEKINVLYELSKGKKMTLFSV